MSYDFSFKFRPKQKVKIHPVDAVGRILALTINEYGVTYYVRYFDDESHIKTEDFFASELESIK